MRIIKFLVSLVFLVSLGVAQADRLASIQKSGVLRVAVYEDRKGFGFKQNGKIVGHEVDIARSLANHLDLNLQLVPILSFDRITVLQNNEADLTVAALTIDDNRKKLINFSIPYFKTGNTFISSRSEKINSQEDFRQTNLTFGAINGSLMQKILPYDYAKVKIKYFDQLPVAFKEFREGKIDGVIAERHFLIANLIEIEDISERIKYRISRVHLDKEPSLFGVGIPKGEDNLRKAVDEVLLEMEELGEAKAIYNKWFGYKSENPVLRTYKIGQN